jgi:hypothetical protein
LIEAALPVDHGKVTGVKLVRRQEFTLEKPEAPVRIMRKSFELSKLPDETSVESAVQEFKRVLTNSIERLTTEPSPHNDRAPTNI